MSKRRATRPLVALTAATLALAGCGSQAPSSGGVSADSGSGSAQEGANGSLTVGLLNPLTGPFAALGEDVNAGFELYLDSKGGQLSDYGINVVKEDPANDPGVATTKARQLVQQEGAGIVIGLVNSGVAYAVAPYLESAGVPLMITVAGADGLTRTKGGNLFRVSYTGSQDTMPAGDYVCKELGLKTAAIVGLDYSFGWEASGGFARTYEDAGCKVVQELYAPLATQDWAPYVTQINRDADVVFAVTPGSDAVRFLKAYRGFGLDTPIFAQGSTTDEQLLPTMGETADGVMSSLHYSPVIDNPANKTFVDAWTEKYDRSTNQYAEDGWAAAQALEAALSDVKGEPTGDGITNAMRNVSIDAPRGALRFDEYGQAIYDVYMRKVTKQDGKWVNKVVDTVPAVNQFYTYDVDEYLQFPPYDKLKGTWAK
ncbi:branched-chain amino acid transport system substrate-binding protein [Modestobacter sp. DSM 44400]|uniref:ABC transporter substrate-binding protein n=1 Tax=Modestobacter sp. DSM 44400 TaxID=1550230 RepID=UPI00089AEED0|nr:ABC transporter substrate-binding protein [Modestobacter sp. DSM 44400]SDX80263.1 branched-chain amino acid transport system substrate-binding protein [Modestobacter sp. DSM 44400]